MTQVVTIGVDIVVVGQYPTGGPRATFKVGHWRWHRSNCCCGEHLDPSGAYTIVEIDGFRRKLYFVQDVHCCFA